MNNKVSVLSPNLFAEESRDLKRWDWQKVVSRLIYNGFNSSVLLGTFQSLDGFVEQYYGI